MKLSDLPEDVRQKALDQLAQDGEQSPTFNNKEKKEDEDEENMRVSREQLDELKKEYL